MSTVATTPTMMSAKLDTSRSPDAYVGKSQDKPDKPER